jgi:hypothetical protein
MRKKETSLLFNIRKKTKRYQNIKNDSFDLTFFSNNEIKIKAFINKFNTEYTASNEDSKKIGLLYNIAYYFIIFAILSVPLLFENKSLFYISSPIIVGLLLDICISILANSNTVLDSSKKYFLSFFFKNKAKNIIKYSSYKEYGLVNENGKKNIIETYKCLDGKIIKEMLEEATMDLMSDPIYEKNGLITNESKRKIGEFYNNLSKEELFIYNGLIKYIKNRNSYNDITYNFIHDFLSTHNKEEVLSNQEEILEIIDSLDQKSEEAKKLAKMYLSIIKNKVKGQYKNDLLNDIKKETINKTKKITTIIKQI